ncbi:MAG: 50S ribosomal protein L17 [Planctomycetales bacterium]|nr:50S ribosomal protein L17 [Planctomycetales bacterium]NIM08525.1 50S ribosomal protein L17 [Planctomycetales bacterium]NIN07996.1 50S ribosomal protein L17 [Planctomycetales bacterium]NIN77125.1 50S ribosomal protein L17 [Planctomycetales bacterium]NIO34309.1 50S ribosomal protein L17 [Planctomycetales bacterium]
MRHRRRGRKLGRNPKHQRALLRSLACNLLLSERETDDDNAAKVKGRIVTTLAKAKEVRPFVERCITIARRTLDDQRRADDLLPDAEPQSDQWRDWRQSDAWQEWNQAVAPVLAARRRAIKLLGNKEAVRILFDDVAPRFEDRPGGYTRIMRLAKPRLGDAGQQAILEFVGVRDRISAPRSEAPRFVDEPQPDSEAADTAEAVPQAAAGEEGPEDVAEDRAAEDVSPQDAQQDVTKAKDA